MSDAPLLYGEQCANCRHDLKIVTKPRSNPEARLGVRCTNCPAGGDILVSGKQTGPAFEGAHGAQKFALDHHTPEEQPDPQPAADERWSA